MFTPPGSQLHFPDRNSSDEEKKQVEEETYVPADVEAARTSQQEEEDDMEGRFKQKWNTFRRSKTAVVLRDAFLILLLVSSGVVCVGKREEIFVHRSDGIFVLRRYCCLRGYLTAWMVDSWNHTSTDEALLDHHYYLGEFIIPRIYSSAGAHQAHIPCLFPSSS